MLKACIQTRHTQTFVSSNSCERQRINWSTQIGLAVRRGTGYLVSFPHLLDTGEVVASSGVEVSIPGAMTCRILPQTVDFNEINCST